MSIQQTLDHLRGLKLAGMAEALSSQLSESLFLDIGFEQRIEMLVEAELAHRENTRFHRLIKAAKLAVYAAPEDVEFRAGRGIDRAKFGDLLGGAWVTHGRNLLITGATGTGKTWLACAFGVRMARLGHPILYCRVNNALDAMATAHTTGDIEKVRSHYARPRLLILDDFGIAPFSQRNRTDLLELIQRREGASTVIAGQLPVKQWHAFIGDDAVADAFMDRLYHGSPHLELKGESMRKLRAKAPA